MFINGYLLCLLNLNSSNLFSINVFNNIFNVRACEKRWETTLNRELNTRRGFDKSRKISYEGILFIMLSFCTEMDCSGTNCGMHE